MLFENLTVEQLERMQAAGKEIQECYRVLRKSDANVVGDILKGQGTFYEWDHYPSGDVFDQETHGQYYYHAHRSEVGEHGHFHTFMRRDGIPARIKAVANDTTTEWPTGDDIICHLVAVSMDKQGYPTHLFTTNRWVTGENWYRADDVSVLLDRFNIDHAYPSWPTNRWLTAMVALFRPQIAELVRQRDEKIDAWGVGHPDVEVFEDRDLEITSVTAVSVNQQIKQVERALKGKRAGN